MITLKTLRWSNAFSYGANNQIDFTQSALTQLVGKNGHGKSSIALILEEVLFNKNSKGIKKADILNRYTKDKTVVIELDFEKDGTPYQIKTSRGSTQTVKLYRAGNDISAHTATATYKIIEDIIGFDHKTFAQIVYQSSASSLEFLTAADTARKKFLIELLNLTKYTKAQEVFKNLAADLNKEIAAAESQIKTVNGWLDKYKTFNLNKEPIKEIDEEIKSSISTKLVEQAEITSSINNLEATNLKIKRNNQWRSKLETLKPVEVPQVVPVDQQLAQEAKQARLIQVELNKDIRDSQTFVKKMQDLKHSCPTCLQTIDKTKISELLDEQRKLQDSARERFQTLERVIQEYESAHSEFTQQQKAYEAAKASNAELETCKQAVDLSLPIQLADADQLHKDLRTLQLKISELQALVQETEKRNREAEAHNAKVDVVSQQLVEMNHDLEKYSVSLHELSEKMGIVNILCKTFSTTGLVAYKIECLVKDLEALANTYLVDLSDGRFQLAFQINSSDKLNVIITDSGKDIDIHALSGGERARVNVATLLAIRKLMQSLSSSRINLLILDETVETLDVDGKEKLVEVLLKEENLNTFLVSHGFTHPLLDKLHVVKINNISHIEE